MDEFQQIRLAVLKMAIEAPIQLDDTPRTAFIHNTCHWIYSGHEKCNAGDPANCKFTVK